MKIYNTTNQVQELRVLDKITKRQFSLYVSARSLFEVSHTINVLNLSKLLTDHIFIIYEDSTMYGAPESSIESVEENNLTTPELEEEKVSTSESEEVKETELTNTTDTKFVCEICGAEFASARGLASHMKRSHSI